MAQPNLASFQQFARVADRYLDPSEVRVVLDVGSRDAEVAIYLQDHYPQAQVFAFECNPDAIRLCRAALQDRPEITLVEKAVSDRDGPLDFYAIDPQRTITPHADGNIGASSLYQAVSDYPHETYVQQRITVDSTTLASWAQAQGVSQIDVIWMDLQGAELMALRGLGPLIETTKLLFTEVEFKPLYQGQPLAAEVRRYLRQHSFRRVKTFNAWEWFADDLFCHTSLLPFWRRCF